MGIPDGTVPVTVTVPVTAADDDPRPAASCYRELTALAGWPGPYPEYISVMMPGRAGCGLAANGPGHADRPQTVLIL